MCDIQRSSEMNPPLGRRSHIISINFQQHGSYKDGHSGHNTPFEYVNAEYQFLYPYKYNLLRHGRSLVKASFNISWSTIHSMFGENAFDHEMFREK